MVDLHGFYLGLLRVFCWMSIFFFFFFVRLNAYGAFSAGVRERGRTRPGVGEGGGGWFVSRDDALCVGPRVRVAGDWRCGQRVGVLQLINKTHVDSMRALGSRFRLCVPCFFLRLVPYFV